MKRRLTVMLSLVMTLVVVSCTQEQPVIIQSEYSEQQQQPIAGEPQRPAAECRTEADFLNSPDGVAFQIAAFRAAKAYLSGASPGQSENLFNRIDYLIPKWSLDSIKSDDEISASYEFKLDGEDSVSYVSMILRKTAGQWQVDSIGLEK